MGNEYFGTETYLDAIEFHPVLNTDTHTTSLTTGTFDGSHTTDAASKAEFCSDGKINMQYKYVGGSQAQDDVADLLTGAWGEAGFNVDITNAKQDTYITEIALGRFQVVNWRQFGAVNPNNDSVFLACDSIDLVSINFPRVCDEERDAALQAQRESADDAERKQLWDLQRCTINGQTPLQTVWLDAS